MREKNQIECPYCHIYNSKDSHFCQNCGSDLQQLEKTVSYPPSLKITEKGFINFSPGDLFADRYLIIEEIGRGGMGIVYKAEDKVLDIDVALKVIHPLYSLSPPVVRRFKRELLHARSVSHENVIRIHDIGEYSDIKYISMDYIKGQNLKELINTSGTLTKETVIKIASQICEALKAAHRKGIVHKDLKPQNIMVDREGKVFALDFGLAESIKGQESILETKIVGTFPYMSPEQAKGEKAEQASDIYSLGVIMYEMLTGSLPFEAETRDEYIQKHISEVPKPPSKLNPAVPQLFDRIIMRCLEKNKNLRYRDVSELLSDLEEEKKVALSPPGFQISKRIRIIAPLVVILLASISVYLIVSKAKNREELLDMGSQKRSAAVLLFENLTGDEELDKYRRIFQYLLTTDLEQSKYLDILPDTRLFQILKKLNVTDSNQYSSEILDKIRSQEPVEYFLLGSFLRSGKTMTITVKMHDALNQRVIGTEEVACEEWDDYSIRFDGMSLKIKERLLTGQQIAGDIDRELGKITTRSLEALELYVEGKRLYEEEGKYAACIELLREAIKSDSEFAMAYALIGMCYTYEGNAEEGRSNIQKAISYKDRVSIRERYFIQADYYNVYESFYLKAIETYQELLKFYPDEEKAIGMMGGIFRNIEEWDSALECFNKVLQIDANRKVAVLNLFEIYRAKGMYDEALSLLDKRRDLFPKQGEYLRIKARTFLAQGKINPALHEMEAAFSLDPDRYMNFLLAGNIYHANRDFLNAEKSYQKLMQYKDPYVNIEGRFWIGKLYLLQGKLNKSREEFESGIAETRKLGYKYWQSTFTVLLTHISLWEGNLDGAFATANQVMEMAEEINLILYKSKALHFLGLTNLRMGKQEEAKKAAERMKLLIEESGYLKLMRHYHHLIGMIALEENQISTAIENFRKAAEMLPFQTNVYDEHVFFLEALAFSYFRNGDLGDARKLYERITILTTGMLTYGDVYARCFYRLGQIYQQANMSEKAIDYYHIFLTLWKDTDSECPEISDAKKQLAQLERESSD